MLQTTFETIAANDGHVERFGSSFPPTGSVSRHFADPGMWTARNYDAASVGTEYKVGNVLMKWDTSDIPAYYTIFSASLRIYCLQVGSFDGATGKLEWYLFDGTDADYTNTPSGTAHAGLLVGNWTNNDYNVLSLLNPDTNIGKGAGGVAGIRMHIDIGGATPTNLNTLGFYTNEATGFDAPQLIVDYGLPGDGPGAGYIQIGP